MAAARRNLRIMVDSHTAELATESFQAPKLAAADTTNFGHTLPDVD